MYVGEKVFQLECHFGAVWIERNMMMAFLRVFVMTWLRKALDERRLRVSPTSIEKVFDSASPKTRMFLLGGQDMAQHGMAW